MVEEKSKSVFRKVIDVKSVGGNIKQQITVDVSPWDTSEMDGYKEGDKVYKGYTCQLRVQKFGRNSKESFVNFDPMNKDIRETLKLMYAETEKLSK